MQFGLIRDIIGLPKGKERSEKETAQGERFLTAKLENRIQPIMIEILSAFYAVYHGMTRSTF